MTTLNVPRFTHDNLASLIESDESNKAPQSVQLIRKFVEEASRARERTIIADGKNIQAWWKFAGRRWLGDHHDVDPKEGLVNVTINRDQVAITNNIADETAQPVLPHFTAVETNEDPIYFMSRTGSREMLEVQELLEEGAQEDLNERIQALASFTQEMSELELRGLVPIRPRHGRKLLELTESEVDPETGLMTDPILKRNSVLVINDQLRAERLEKMFELKWEQAKGSQTAVENIFHASLYGHSVMWATIREDNWQFDLENLHPLHALADPSKSMLHKMGYLLIIENMTLSDAISRFPEHEEDLVHAAQTGKLDSDEDGWALGAVMEGIDFTRKMVKIQNCYMREPSGKIRFMKTMTQINAELVNEISPYSDIPVLWNLNLPIAHSHYGMGESFRLKDIADVVNRSAAVLVNHLLYYAYPAEIWPSEVLDEIKTEGNEEIFTHPGSRWECNGALLAELFTGGKRGFLVDPPEMPNTALQIFQEFLTQHDVLSGFQSVRQGRLPSANVSGVAIDELLEQASGPIALRAKYYEDGMEHIGRVLADRMAQDMPIEEWGRVYSDLTEEALKVVFDGIKTLQYDVSVSIATGKGANKQRDQEQALENLAGGLQSKITTARIRDIQDPEGEQRKIMKELALQPQPLEQRAQGQ